MTRQRKIVRAIAACSAVLTTLLAFACGATGSDSGQAPADAPSLTRTTAPSSPSAAPPASATAAAQPMRTSTCVAADLSLAVADQPGGGAAGTIYRALRFTNSSGAPCVMVGFPGVSFVTGDNGKQVGDAALRVGSRGAQVTIPPGGSAQAQVGFAQVDNFDPAACRKTPVRGLRVYPPHDTASMFVAAPGSGCAGANLPGSQLTVSTVR